MKKYSVPVTAVVLAIIFSAYTGPDKVSKKKILLATFSKWYNTQNSGTQVGTLEYNGTSVDMNHLPFATCANQRLPVCMVGSNTALTQGSALPSKIDSGDPNVPDDADNYILEGD